MPFLKFGLIRRFVDPCISLENMDQIGGPWIPSSTLKIPTKSAVRGSLYLLLQFGLIRPSMDPCIHLSRDFTWGARMTHNLSFNPYESSIFHHHHIRITIQDHKYDS